MAFSPKNRPDRYVPAAQPILPGSEKMYLERELRKLSIVVEKLVASVEEIQDYLKTLPGP